MGFEKAGFKVILANELMSDAAETYRANHPDTLIVNADIYSLMGTLDRYRGADLVFGGPPCQGFSVAGKMDPDDKRSQLIFAFLDAVEKIQPRAFVMENVKALGCLERWEPVREKYLGRVRQLGYSCCHFILNAVDFGVSQKRERVFFVGIRDNADPSFAEHMRGLLDQEKRPAITIRELLHDLGPAGTEKNPRTCRAKITFMEHPVMRKTPYSGMYFNGLGRPIDIDGYAKTLVASMGGNRTPFVDEEYLHGDAEENWVVNYHKGLMDGTIVPRYGEAPSRLRRLTIREVARIQSFPDDYVFCGNKSRIYAQIGNAVPCGLAEAVAKAVRMYLDMYTSRN